MKRLNLRWPAAAILSIILAVTALTAPSAYAQGTDSGTVTGKVADATGALIPGATITLTNLATKEKFSTVTNKDGSYVLTGVKPATYQITATKAGFNTDQIGSQDVQVGTQTTANFALAVGAESTVVEVVASNADLQTLNSTVGDTVTQAQINAMPAIARDVSSFATLQPGVSPGGSVAGTPADQAVFMVDGGNNSSDMDGSMQSYTGAFAGDPTDGKVGGGASGVMPTPQDSVEEFRVATSNQTADFNNSSGSQVQIVTKRGTNQIKGTAYYYYLDNSFSGNSWQFGSTLGSKAIAHYSRFGASAGGPIAPYVLGGKTYLFGNYEGFRYPLSALFDRVVPTTNFENGIINMGGTNYTAAQIKAADPRGLGLSALMQNYWQKYEPQQGTTYAGGYFLPQNSGNGCGGLASTVTCDGYNEVTYEGKAHTPQTSNFIVLRLDHDFGSKEHFFISWRNFKLVNQTSNQVDFGQYFAGDNPVGSYTAIAPRPQQPWFLVAGLTTNITPSFTNTLHYSYLRNFWSWGDKGSPAPTGCSLCAGLGGAPEAGGESSSAVLAPITIAAQSIRTRFWDGHDHFLAEDLTKLKGNHLIQFGGQYQHNFNYHQRTDNGSTLDYYPVYQLGETANAGLLNFPGFTANGIPANTGTNERLLAMNTAMITDNQIMYTRAGANLTLNPPLTPGYDQTTIQFFNGYVSDTWKARSNLTLNVGLGYAYEKPPVEANGKIVSMVDSSGNLVVGGQYLANKKAAALLGQSYNPEIGYALVGNTGNGLNKYPINPFHAAFSPRISLAWNPKVENKWLKAVMGENSTVVRGGYGRVYGRLNGVGLVLTTLLGPGILQGVDCQNQLSPAAGGGCGTTSNDTTGFRLGTTASGADGLAPAAPAAAATLPQPYFPGYNGVATAIPQSLDPSLRPSSVDSFNLTIQRQLSRKTLIEVGYIGRIIKNEVEALNIDDAPYMLAIGGQNFANAYLALEQAFGCTVNISTCLATSNNTTIKPTAVYPAVAAQPFFEAALPASYCNGYTNCTTAVLHKEESNIASQKAWQIFKDLDAVGINGAPRNLTDTPITGSAFGANGQITGGAELLGSYGYGNYNGLFTTFKLTDYHGLTLSSTFTYSKALGLNDSAQSSSGLIPDDSYDLRKSYGVQSFNQKFIGSIYGAYNTPWFKEQNGILGRLAGGWNIAPIFAFGSGTPKYCTDNSSSNEAFGGGSGSFASGDNEQCVVTGPRPYSEKAYRGVIGVLNDPVYAGIALPTTVAGVTSTSTLKVATTVASTNQPATEVNEFTNPVALWDSVRPPILGLDEHNSGEGVFPGLRYWNLDAQVRKTIRVWERGQLEFSAISTNIFNHLVFANGGTSLTGNTTFGVISSQGNSPRNIQLGLRATY